jgi:phosphate binding protein
MLRASKLVGIDCSSGKIYKEEFMGDRRKHPLVMMLALALFVPPLIACGNTATTGSTTAAPEATSVTGATALPAATTAPAVTETGAAPIGELPEVDPAAATGNIVTAGSSTVFPLSQVMVERFKDEGYTGDITIDSIGTGAGFERFCKAGETDIANASRAIKQEETANCQAIGRTPIEFRVGTDALVVVVSSENTFLTDISLEELARVFNGEAKTWADINPSYPAERIQLFSPGTDSGTYDYFVEVVLGDDASKLQAAGAQFSENDNVLVQGVEGSPYAIGYFGYAYFKENQGKLKALSLDGITPDDKTAEDGSYPLARPLFIYSDAKVIKQKPQVGAFINFYLSYVNDEIGDVGYFPASNEALGEAKQHLLAAMK